MTETQVLARDLIGALDRVEYLTSLSWNRCKEPYEWQQDVLRSEAQYIVINGSRRGGKSVVISTIPGHEAKYHRESVTLILCPTEKQSVEDMRLFKAFIARDPTYPEIKRFSDQQVELVNGSRVIIIPATEISARGYPNPDLIITDEAAYIEDNIFEDCILPMFNDNEGCRWIMISTPNGKTTNPGRFFFETFKSKAWERFEVRAPWDVDPNDNLNLVPYLSEKAFKADRAAKGIRGYYSPRHKNLARQLWILERQTVMKYRRNQLCEFVEADEQVFSYEEIERAFGAKTVNRLDLSGIKDSPLKPIEVFP